MTTLISWVSRDQRASSAIHVASDSRITWGSERNRWDAGRKVFASATTPDVFGYCGDVVFPALVLGQIASAADAGLLFPAHSTATDRHNIVLDSFKASMGRSHNAPTQAFSILHASREETAGRVMPLLWHVSYDIQGRWGDTLVTPMDGSGVYALHGSGAKTAKEELHRWAGTDIGGTVGLYTVASAKPLRLGQMVCLAALRNWLQSIPKDQQESVARFIMGRCTFTDCLFSKPQP